MLNVTPGFIMKYDLNPSNVYPHGYWYVVTTDGGYDADGLTPLEALAKLVEALHEALLKKGSEHRLTWLISLSLRRWCRGCLMTYRVGVTATRESLRFNQIATAVQLFRNIAFAHDLDGPIEFHQGCCVGGDEQLTIIAATFGWRIVAHPPEKTDYFSQLAYDLSHVKNVRKPYLYRNQDIVKEVDELLAFPKGVKEEMRSGTWSTVRYARGLYKATRIIAPDGSLI